MYTAAALLDIHERTHRSLAGLLDHCATLNNEQLATPCEGFGFSTILEQLHHAIGAERYWCGVLRGEMLTDEPDEERASIDALRALRSNVAEVTTAYLRQISDADANAARSYTTWGGKNVELVPALVILRTQTHVFQHQGQIAAMARLLGHPIPRGLDFPLQR